MRRAAVALVAVAAMLVAEPAGAVVPGSNGLIAFTRPEKILVMQPDGSGIELLATGAADPAWSPDGTEIAFSGRRPSGKTDIFVMDEDGSNVRALTRFRPGFNLSPTWSPDGTTIVFRHSSAEGNDLYSVRADGSGLTRITTSPRIVESAPEWSPDGSRILLSRLGPAGGFRLNKEELYLMDPDGTDLVRLTDNNVQDSQASWSPDGERIVFVRQTTTGSKFPFGSKAFLRDVDGGDAVRLTNDALEEFWPSFSPDGTRIVLVRCADFTCDLYLVDPDGTDLVQLTHGPRLESSPSWQAV